MSQFRNLKRNIDRVLSPYPFTPAASEAHTQYDTDTVVGLNVPKGVYEVLVQATDQNIRYTLDGTLPTTTLGFRLTAGNDPIAIPVVGGRTTLRFISETAGATLELQYGE